MTIDERRDILIQLADNQVAKEAINVAYELFQETGYRCPVCGWTMTDGSFGPICHSEYCVKPMPLLTDVLKVDGNFAIAWSGSLDFTVERSGKSLLGSAASGEGLVNVYRGTGKVLLAPVR